MKLQAAKKGSSVILLALLAASMLLMIPQATSVQTKPTVPEVVSVRYVDLSYYTETTYGTDQYTGQTVVKTEGQLIDNRSIAVTIKNRPYTSPDPSNNLVGLFFNFRVKGAYGTNSDWDYYPFAPDGQSTNTYGGPFVPLDERPAAPAFSQSSGEYTTITFEIPNIYFVPKGATLDIQVQAIDGSMGYYDKQYGVSGERSDWSETKTVTLSGSSSTPIITPSPTLILVPTVTPNYPINSTQSGNQQGFTVGFDWQTILIIALATAVAILVAIVLLMKRANRTKKVAGF